MNKCLIVGLGNPGAEYENTRHNIGFRAADAFTKANKGIFETKRLAEVAETKVKGKTFIIVKPNTFMNLSGKAVNYWMQEEKILMENILVVTDDIALPLGTLRMRSKGSDGGHNGLKNISEVLNSPSYVRLRFGVGNEFSKGKQVDYVLGEWTNEEEKVLPERIELVCEMIKNFGLIGAEKTMSMFNGK